MKIKTSEATNIQIDWLVAKCEEACTEWHAYKPFFWNSVACINVQGHDVNYRPSTDWTQGGPIIEREKIAMSSAPDGLWAAYMPKGTRWLEHGGKTAEVFNWYFKQMGYTPLIAAMRCYVASKMGEEVEIPEELT